MHNDRHAAANLADDRMHYLAALFLGDQQAFTRAATDIESIDVAAQQEFDQLALRTGIHRVLVR